jgi:hypothetical protein
VPCVYRQSGVPAANIASNGGKQGGGLFGEVGEKSRIHDRGRPGHCAASWSRPTGPAHPAPRSLRQLPNSRTSTKLLDVTAPGPASSALMPRDSHSPGYPVYLSYSPRALAIHVTLAQTPGTARTAIALLLRTYYTLHPVTVPCPLATWKNQATLSRPNGTHYTRLAPRRCLMLSPNSAPRLIGFITSSLMLALSACHHRRPYKPSPPGLPTCWAMGHRQWNGR